MFAISAMSLAMPQCSLPARMRDVQQLTSLKGFRMLAQQPMRVISMAASLETMQTGSEPFLLKDLLHKYWKARGILDSGQRQRLIDMAMMEPTNRVIEDDISVPEQPGTGAWTVGPETPAPQVSSTHSGTSVWLSYSIHAVNYI